MGGSGRGMPASVPARLYAAGRWTLDEAVGSARGLATATDRAVALAELASAEGAGHLWTESIDMAASVGSVPADVWSHLARLLPSTRFDQALAAIARVDRPEARIPMLGALAAYLPTGLLPAALATLTDDDEFWIAEGLCQLAPHLPPDLVPTAFDLADAVADEEVRADALLVLSAYLPAGWSHRLTPEFRQTMVTDVAGARGARLLEDESQDLCWQEVFTRRLPGDLLAEAVSAAEAIDPEGAAFILAGLAPRLPDQLVGRAWAVARSLPDRERAWASVGLAPYRGASPTVDGDEPPAWFTNAFLAHPVPVTAAAADCWAIAARLPDGWRRDYLLARSAPGLPAERLPEAVDRLIAALVTRPAGQAVLRDPGHLWSPPRSRSDVLTSALAALAPRLAGPELARAWSAVSATSGGSAQWERALAELAARLPVDLIPAVLAFAGQLPVRVVLPDRLPRYSILRAVADRVPDELVPDGIDALVPVCLHRHAQGDPQTESTGLMARLVDRLPPSTRSDVLARALATIGNLTPGDGRASALARIAPNLPAELVPGALAIANGLPDDDSGATAAVAAAAPIDLLAGWYTHSGA